MGIQSIIKEIINLLKEHGINAGVATIYNGGHQTTAIILNIKLEEVD